MFTSLTLFISSFLKKPSIIAICATLLVTGCNQSTTESKEATLEHDTTGHTHDEHSHSHDEHEHVDDLASTKVPTTTIRLTDSLSITNAYAKASIPGQKISSAYFKLINHSSKPLAITRITSEQAGNTEFHTMTMQDGTMQMRQIPSPIVPANGELVLAQGGDHVMLMDLAKPLTADDTLALSLSFDTGETVDLLLPIQ